MSSTAFIEPLPVIEFVSQLLNRDVSLRPLSDADRVKVSCFCRFPIFQSLLLAYYVNLFLILCSFYMLGIAKYCVA